MPYNKYNIRKQLESKADPIFYEWAQKNDITYHRVGVETYPEEIRQKLYEEDSTINHIPDFQCFAKERFYMEVKYQLSIEKNSYTACLQFCHIQKVVIFVYVPEDSHSIYGKGTYFQDIRKIGFITRDKAYDNKKDNYIDDIWRKKPEDHNHQYASGMTYALIDVNTMIKVK